MKAKPRPTIRLPRLFSYRARSLKRRLGGVGALTSTLLSLLALAALASLAVGFAHLALQDAAAATPEAATARIRETVFWLAAGPIIVFAYTSFEVLFRPGDARFVSTLPIPGQTRFADLFVRAVVVHLPLYVPALAYAGGLLFQGLGQAALYAALVPLLGFVLGLPACAWVHLMAGRTLIGDASKLRKMLASGFVDDDAAWLIYAPAGGLALTLFTTVVADLFVAKALLQGQGSMLWPPLAWSGIGALLAFREARRIAARGFFAITARFNEVEMPPPYRDDGVPERTPGEGLASWLPPAARPWFAADLRQLRRRFRLDKVLLGLYALLLVILGIREEAHVGATARHLVLLVIVHGLLLVSAFRVHGRELSSPWLSATLPADPRARRLGRFVAGIILPLWAWAFTTAGAALAGGAASAALVAGVGLAAVLLIAVLSQALAAWAFPQRVAIAAIGWRAGVVSLAGVVLWQGM